MAKVESEKFDWSKPIEEWERCNRCFRYIFNDKHCSICWFDKKNTFINYFILGWFIFLLFFVDIIGYKTVLISTGFFMVCKLTVIEMLISGHIESKGKKERFPKFVKYMNSKIK